MWLNITIHAQSELFTVIRQLEFALLRLNQQLDELTNVVQCAISGKIPINFITLQFYLKFYRKYLCSYLEAIR